MRGSMSWYSKLNLKLKFLLFTSLVVIAICAGNYFFVDRIFRSYLQSEMQDEAREISTSLEDQLFNFIDPRFVQSTASRMLNERREISRIMVFRRNGNLMENFIEVSGTTLPDNIQLYSSAVNKVTSFRHEFQYRGTEFWEFAHPVLVGTKVAGLITITMNFSQYKVFMGAVRSGTLVILFIGLIILMSSMSIYFEGRIHKPLSAVLRAMSQVRGSNLEVRIPASSQDEIGKLVENFNEMIVSLRSAQQEIMNQNRRLEERVREATRELQARNMDLFQAQDELRRASRLATAGQVGAMLAHDLGSPLSSISGHLQLMLEDPARRDEDKQRLNLLLSQMERLSDTIYNFLHDVTGFRGEFKNCNLNEVLDHIIKLTTPLLSAGKIETVVRMDDSLPDVSADPHQLQQLFLNLFTNAKDAMRDGGRLVIRTKQLTYDDDDYLRFAPILNGNFNSHPLVFVSIEDTGIGMNQTLLKNLFQPFFSTKEFGKGSGLGLAICKEIVKAHRGQIFVESHEGSGTAFRIVFPAATYVQVINATQAESTHSR